MWYIAFTWHKYNSDYPVVNSKLCIVLKQVKKPLLLYGESIYIVDY